MYVEAHDSIDMGSDHRVIVAHFRFLVRDPQERTSDGKRMCESAAKISDAVTTHEIKEKVFGNWKKTHWRRGKSKVAGGRHGG